MARMRKGGLTIPGAGTPTLRQINQLWHIYDASNAIPYDLHPNGPHRAELWTPTFQWKLKYIARMTSPEELENVKQRMPGVVYYRHQGRSNRALYVKARDLDTVRRQLERIKTKKRAHGVQNA